MTTELYWMTLTLLATSLFWIVYIPDRIRIRGMIPALTSRKPEVVDDQSVWAQRAVAAHRNAVENLVIFAPAVLALQATDTTTSLTQGAAAVYFFARIAHFVVYTAGIPMLRTLTFFAGLCAQLAILATVLGWL